MIGIYKVTNLINNKKYIGQSINIEERWKRHKSHSLNNYGNDYNCVFYRAIRKYGLENFKFEVIEECCKEDLDKKEKYWIKYYNTYLGFLNCNGYNMTLGGQNASPHFLTYEQVKEIQNLLRSTFLSQTEIGNQYNVSQVTISQINRGLIWVDEELNYPLRKRTYKTGNIIAGKKKCPICGKLIEVRSQYCRDCYLKQKKYNFIQSLPVTKEELEELLLQNKGNFSKTSKVFGISDNGLRKWCKNLGLSTHSSDYK